MNNLNNELKEKVEKILHIKQGKDQLIIGCVFKEMKLKPSVFDSEIKIIEKNKNYCSESDIIYLDDETGKVRLRFNNQQQKEQITQGSIICVRGVFIHEEFIVKQIIHQVEGLKEIEEEEINILNFINESSSIIMILSGLDIEKEEEILNLQSIILGKRLGLMRILSEKLSDIIIAGNLFQSIGQNLQDNREIHNICMNTNLHLVQKLDSQDIKVKAKKIDKFLMEIVQQVQVLILPHHQDMSNSFWPQQSIPRFFFPQSQAYSSLQLLTNPSRVTINDKHCIITDGENIHDIIRYTNQNQNTQFDYAKAISQTVQYAHLLPTSPDTLRCYPFHQEDIHVLNSTELSNISLIIAGNMPYYQSKIYTNSQITFRAIAVPEFSQSQQVVLLDTKSLRSVSLKLKNIQ